MTNVVERRAFTTGQATVVEPSVHYGAGSIKKVVIPNYTKSFTAVNDFVMNMKEK